MTTMGMDMASKLELDEQREQMWKLAGNKGPMPKEMREALATHDQRIKADAGKPRLSLVPSRIMYDIAIIREYGNKKYGDSESWKQVDPQRYIDAMLRHALAFAEDPTSVDEESKLPHLWHLECNCAFLSEFYKEQLCGVVRKGV